MKNLFRFSLLVLWAFAACTAPQPDTEMTEEWARFLSSVTQGEVNFDDEIVVQFNDLQIDEQLIDTDIPGKVFSFSPKLKGRTYWKSRSVIAFKPNKGLKYGKMYHGSVHFDALTQIKRPDSLTRFNFTFEVPEMHVKNFDGQIQLINTNDPSKYRFEGELEFSSKVDTVKLNKGVTLKLDGKKVPITFKLGQSSRAVSLKSEAIERSEQPRTLVLEVDKATFNMAAAFWHEVTLTPVNEMSVISIQQDIQGKNPKIRIEFSDELSAKQDVNGLVSLKPAQSFKLLKMGNSLLLDGNFSFGTSYELTINKGVESRWGTRTDKLITQTVTFPDIEPQIEFVSNGIYLPSDNDFRLQFYTCNLQRVHIEVKKVFESGLKEFIQTEQVNSLKDRHSDFNNTYTSRLGVLIHNESFEIGNQKNKWLLSEIDLSDVIDKHQKGLYLVRLNFNTRDMLTGTSQSAYEYIAEKGQIYKPIIFSNIGLTTKKTSEGYLVYATDLNTAKPLSGVKLTLQNYWETSCCRGVATTDAEGKALVKPGSDCYYSHLLAEKDDEKSVIKFEEMEWNTSGFDVSGVSAEQRLTQAFAYTERGVYRPGDAINLSVIARHAQTTYPDNRPLTVDLYNPEGKKVYTVSSKTNRDGFYSFLFQTEESDPTGNWEASFQIGQNYYSHTIKIETVVANRLKSTLKTNKDVLSKEDSFVDIDLTTLYLFGAPAADHAVELKAEFLSLEKKFDAYKQYTFHNPAVDFSSFDKSIAQTRLDANGQFKTRFNLPGLAYAPSGILMKIQAKVFEKGGRANDFWHYVPIDPVRWYVGIQNTNWGYIQAGTDMNIPVILLDAKGQAAAGKTLKYRIYRNTQNWWWQYDSSRKLRFKSDTNTTLVTEGELKTGTTAAHIRFNPNENGSYFLEVIDAQGDGHSCGMFFNAYRYGYESESDNNAGMLALRSDRDKYTPGQTIRANFPSTPGARALVSVEQGDKVLFSKWYDAPKGDEMTVEIPVTDAMVPNVYVSVSLVQPQKQTANDRPIRMFGILPVTIVDPSTIFGVNIGTSAQLRPEEPFEITVQTANRKSAQFTIAVVDEGLLDLTQFQTPSPWNYFFQKVGLGVRTFDLFSQVISANLGDVFKTFAIGGDMNYRRSQQDPNKNKKRFQPVCLFQGPLQTDAKGFAKVRFDMPNYVGSVRIMVVAASGNSYGSADKTVPVKKELMVLPTLPRVMGPDETVKVPVSVFAMIANMGTVNVTIETTGPATVSGSNKQTLNFTQMADKECFFTLKTLKQTGISTIKITAESSKYKASYTVDLSVRPSAPREFGSSSQSLAVGQTLKVAVPARGVQGSNRAKLTLAPLPGLQFGHRLDWLIHYPYGCLEQTVSGALPQLRIAKFIEFPEARVKEIDAHINAAIERLRRFQTYSGAFTYWPGSSDVSEWASLYATHFLVEAGMLGYHIPEDLYANALRGLQDQANSNTGSWAERAYRVYILALANKAVVSEMNLLYENRSTAPHMAAKWQLATAFYLNGQKDRAEELARSLTTETNDYNELSGTFGSALRDQAIILEALIAMKKTDQATELVKTISAQLATQQWYSTQTLGYSINAVGKYVAAVVENGQPFRMKGEVVLPDGTKRPFETGKSKTFDVSDFAGKDVEIRMDASSNFSKAFALVDFSGIPLKSEAVAEAKNLALTAQWYDENGQSVNPATLKQGTSVWAHFKVKNTSSLERVEELALVFMLPSGWEVQNTRLNAELLPDRLSSLKLGYESYMDIRDDRVMWFFDLHRWEPLLGEMDFVLKLNAVNQGQFYMPPLVVEAMYNPLFVSRVAGRSVTVVP
jgi:alpha-2-macroglobulin